MKIAKIVNGKVVNRIIADSLDIFPNSYDVEGELIPGEPFYTDGENAKIGDDWDGATFTTPAEPVTEVVTRMQAMEALEDAGLLDNIETLMQSQTKRDRMRWKNASEFNRRSKTIAKLQVALSLTDQQLDDLFIAAGQISDI